MRALALLAGLLCCVQAWGDTLYVRSKADCAANGCGATDGSTYENAFAGTADVAQGNGAGQWGAGDTLCAYGSFVGTSEVDVSGITVRIDTSGTDADTRTTLDGDCDGDGNYALLDGAGQVGIGIRTAISGTSRTTWTKVRRIRLTGYTNKSIVNYNVTGDLTADANQLWEYISITNNGDGGAGDNCFDSRGRYVELSHTNISGCDEDGVYHQGKYFRSDYLTVGDVSRANASGDGLQLAGEADGYWVSHFICDHTKVDSKQCFIASVLSDTGANGVFEDADIQCKPGALDQNCAFLTGVNAVGRRIYSTGGQYGIVIEDSTDSSGIRLEASIVKGATMAGVNIAGTNPTGIEIANVAAAFNGGAGFSTTSANPVTFQNSIAYGNTGCGFNRATAGQTERTNDSYNNGTAFCVAGNSSAAGTGSVLVFPDFDGGATPITKQGFRLKPTSPLKCAGTSVGRRTDALGRGFEPGCTLIGAMVYGRGDARGTALPARP